LGKTAMNFNAIVKDQFNKQAANFDSWCTPKNLDYLKGFLEFVSISCQDTLLDVASGTGDFVVFSSDKVREATGVDISDKLIELSRNKKDELHLTNINFKIGDVENLPFEDNSFTVVTCKSSLHHMPRYEKVFAEMLRCCKRGGRVALCDIMTFDDKEIDDIFEAFEKLVDLSHYKTLRKTEFEELFHKNHIAISRTFQLQIEHTIPEYLTHAYQSDENLQAIKRLMDNAKNIQGIERFLDNTDRDMSEMKFRRQVFLISGVKQ
jgi:ubiquinone/menaquinone biosynthesis C-methylase UbiE